MRFGSRLLSRPKWEAQRQRPTACSEKLPCRHEGSLPEQQAAPGSYHNPCEPIAPPRYRGACPLSRRSGIGGVTAALVGAFAVIGLLASPAAKLDEQAAL